MPEPLPDQRRLLHPKWTVVPAGPLSAVVVSNFNQDSNGLHQLRVTVGDTVLVYEELEGWYYGCLTHDRKCMGIFPKNFVVVRQHMTTTSPASAQETGSCEQLRSKETPVVQEVTTTLREWGSIIEQRFLDPHGGDLTGIRSLLYDLIRCRSQVLSGTLPIDKLRELRWEISRKIDHGNAMLGLDVVVRDEQGNILHPMQTSTIDLFRAHLRAHQNIANMSRSDAPGDRDSTASAMSGGSSGSSHQLTSSLYPKLKSTSISNNINSSTAKVSLHLTVYNFTCRIGEDADLQIALYDGREQKFISENYLVSWGKQGFVKDVEQIHNLKCLFTDLGSKDLLREKILLVCQVIRIGAMELKETSDQGNSARSRIVNPSKKPADGLRRPFGVAAMDITEYISEAKSAEDQICVPFIQCSGQETLESVLKRFLRNDTRKEKGPGLWVTMKVLRGDFNNLVASDYGTRFAASTALPFGHVARKMGFPDVVMPGDIRNDLYLTLNSAEFISKAYNAKNIEVTVRVCNEKGAPVADVITQGAGADTQSEYKSVVYYHDEKPKWAETFKIMVPIEEFYGSHIRFLFKHRSSNESKDRNEKPFALSYIRLGNINGTTINDGPHKLLIYKLEKKWEEGFDNEHSQYLKLPSTDDEFHSRVGPNPNLKTLVSQFSTPALTLLPKDSFIISTVICSTKLTQNYALMNLLSMSPEHATDKDIEKGLREFMHVDGEEIVKFLQDVLDVLFRIFAEKHTDRINRLFFESLIRTIGLISDPKYVHFRPVLDTYIDDIFSWPTVYDKLILVLKSELRDVIEKGGSNGSSDDQLSQTNGLSVMSEGRGSSGRLFEFNNNQNEAIEFVIKILKSLEYLMKLIVRSRTVQSTMLIGMMDDDFAESMIDLFETFCELMQHDTRELDKVKEQVFKYFPTIIPDVMKVFDGPSLSTYLSLMLANVPLDRLKQQKISYISDIIHTECFFKLSECRFHILPVITDHIRVFMQKKSKDKRFNECVEVLSEVLRLLYDKESGSTDDDIHSVMHAILRPVIREVIRAFGKDKSNNDVTQKLVSILIAILNQMKPKNFKEYFDGLKGNLRDFLIEIITVFKSLVDDPVFPKDCIEMILHQNHVMLTSMRHISRCIRDKFSIQFEHQLWNNFFHCAISFLTQPHLQLETFTPNKRDRILAIYGDMRKEAAIEVRAMWYSLGSNKCKFVPGIVGPFVEMTLIPDSGLRRETTPIFFDMILSEIFEPVTDESGSSPTKIKGHFKNFEREMITQLDKLVEGGRGDQEYKDMIQKQLFDLWENHQFREQGLQFVKTIVRLLKRLLEYRQVASPTEDNRDNSMLCIVNILEFYSEIKREELYLRYLYKLVELHRDSQNYVEAAYTLQLHTRLLKWTDDPLPSELKAPCFDGFETHRALKQRLYIEIIDLFDTGKLWEEGLRFCKDLARQYEEEMFDYTQLSDLHLKMSKYYNNIMTQLRPEAEYFRVGFYGKGFPVSIQNKTFIYRGKEYERIGTCINRLLNQYPKAKTLSSSDAPSDEILNSNDQYILVTTVQPVMRLREDLKSKSISDQILKYYKVNEIKKFQFSKSLRKPSKGVTNPDANDNGFANVWIERTTFRTAYPLPGILRMFPVVEVEKSELSPIEVAVEDVERTNSEIKALILQLIADPNASLSPLTMKLQGVISAFVNGGMVNYEKAFFNESFLRENANDSRIQGEIVRLKKLIAQQIPLLESGLEYQQQRISPDMRKLHDHLVSSFRVMRLATEEKYGKEVIPQEILDAQNKRKEQTARQSGPEDMTPSKPMHYRPRNLSAFDLSTLGKRLRRQGSKDIGEHKRKQSSQFFTDLAPRDEEEESLTSSQTSILSGDRNSGSTPCIPTPCILITSSPNNGYNNNNVHKLQSSPRETVILSESHPRIRPARPADKGKRPNSGEVRNLSKSPACMSNISIDSIESGCNDMMQTSMSSIQLSPTVAFTPPQLPPKSATPSAPMADLTTIGPIQRPTVKTAPSKPYKLPIPLPSDVNPSVSGNPFASSSGNGSVRKNCNTPPPVVPRKSLAAVNREEDVYKNINSVRSGRR